MQTYTFSLKLLLTKTAPQQSRFLHLLQSHMYHLSPGKKKHLVKERSGDQPYVQLLAESMDGTLMSLH